MGQVVGWKEYCGPSHAEARQAFLHWASCSKPRYGPTFDHMKRTRSYFKFTLRQCRANEDRVLSNNLARRLPSKQLRISGRKSIS